MAATSDLFSRLADLDVEIDAVERRHLVFPTARWNRVSTIVVMRGAGLVGVGEDVSYDPADQQDHVGTPVPALVGRRTLAEWSAVLDTVDLTPGPLAHPESRDYRRWSYEGALLDLALRQAGTSLAGALGRAARPVRFCVSPAGDIRQIRELFPHQELKVDASAGWSVDDMRAIADVGGVRVVDLKAHYTGEWIVHPDDPAGFSRRVAAAFPDAVLEDPAVGADMAGFLSEFAGRISFDAPVHSVEDLRSLPDAAWCNIKPSRFGTVRRLMGCIGYCEQTGISMYGGGQFEIGPGRAQIQALASVLYPDGPNDVAPRGYNAAVPDRGLPTSPLPAVDVVGFAPQGDEFAG